MKNGSGTIRVRKRDGGVEDFDVAKLTRSLWRVISPAGKTFDDACQLAWAIHAYLRREGTDCLSSAVVFEMALKVLRRIRLGRAASALEAHRACRSAARRRLTVLHNGGKATMWDKAWAAGLAVGGWNLLPVTGRILAGRIEANLLAGRRRIVGREEIIKLLNAEVSACGLADAVPVGMGG